MPVLRDNMNHDGGAAHIYKVKAGVAILIIRRAEVNDLKQILVLYEQLEIDQKCSISPDAAKAIFNKIQNYPDYDIYIAVTDGKIVGTFSLAILDNIAHMGACSGLVEDVVVAEDYRHKGVGRQMMTYAMDRCKQKGCYKLALSSNVKRVDVHKFYESLGFKAHGYSFFIEL